MHKGQTMFTCRGGIDGKADALASEGHFRALVGLVKAGENLNECRFARTVPPDEPVYFATANNEVGIAQGGGAAKGLGEVAQLERRLSRLSR